MCGLSRMNSHFKGMDSYDEIRFGVDVARNDSLKEWTLVGTSSPKSSPKR